VPEAAVGGASAAGWPGRGEVDQPVTESNRCPACGRAIHPGDRFCAACGQQLGEPGFVPPAAPAPSSVSTGASGPGAAGGWPDVPPATADAAWMPPGRAATVAAVVAGGRGGAEAGTAAESVRLLGAETPDAPGRGTDVGQSAAGYPGDPHAPARGEDASAIDIPDVGTGTATGWGLAPASPSPIVPASEAAPRSENTALGRSTAAADDDANWFAATRPSTLVAWG
jgi:hypothetical protein